MLKAVKTELILNLTTDILSEINVGALWWRVWCVTQTNAELYQHSLVHGQVTIIFVVSVCLFVQRFSQPSLIRF